MKPEDKQTQSGQAASDSKAGGTTLADAVDAPREANAGQCTDDVAILQAKVAALEDALLRAKADLQNQQRRSASDRADAIRFANADLMRSLLGVIDDFERTLAAADDPDNQKVVLDGIKMVHQNFAKALADAGLEIIDAKGRSFDPTMHEALMQQPTRDVQPGVVVEQIAKGYKLRDRMLRPARVVVAKAPD